MDTIIHSFDEYRNDHLQEKLFIHTDKPFYMAGEIIWCKVYVTDAHLHKPLNLSKLCYVELLNKDHKPVLQAKLALDSGMGNGSFQLPYSVNSGNYILRGYTNWMKNSSADFFFEKPLTIVNALRKPEWPQENSLQYDIQFFPEGGNLVHGIESKIAFRVTDKYGNGVNCAGAVLNARNDTIVRFTTLRFGMGHFMFTPDLGEQYHAVIKTGNGNVIVNTFPAINRTGVVMRITEQDADHLLVTAESNAGDRNLSLLVHTRLLVKLVVTRELFNKKAEILIDKKQLGEGISHFTVFDDQYKPVCERLYFRKPSLLTLNIQPNAAEYGQRKKVTVAITANNNNAQPVQGNLSMSVYLLDSLQGFGSTNISSYLWLESDLKGRIESPAYYFAEATPEQGEATDNLVLTQGWRRFRWENVMQRQKRPNEFLPEIEGHIMNGKLVDKQSGRPVENMAAYLSVPGEKALLNNAVSTSNGQLRFNVKNFYGGNEIVLQAGNTAGSTYRIDIASPFSEKYAEKVWPVFQLSEKNANLLAEHSVHSQVDNAYLADKKQNFLYPPALDTMPFYGLPDKRFYLDEYTRFITMEEVMREYVDYVRLRNNNNHFSFRIKNKPLDIFFETDPLVLMDGVPIFDINKLIAFDPLKIKRIDVVPQRFYQNQLLYDGIISFSTYQGDLAGYPLDANALIVEYAGLQLPREFFSPKYETNLLSNTRLPDFRNVLYWSPDVCTDKNGKKEISFYTGDIPGRYGIVLQGITANGLTGSKTFFFTVTK